MEKTKVGLKSKLMYGCGDIFGGGAFLLVSLLLLNYLTDVEFMAPAAAGVIIMIGKAIDAVWDPIMGSISDRTKSKFGRRRLYFLLGIIPIFISFTLLWYSFGIKSKIALFIYYIIVYVLFNMVFSMVMIPYNSILPEMTKDYKERTSFTGIRMIFSVTSAIAAGVLPKILIKSLGGTNIKLGYLIMALIFSALYSIPWLIVFFGTWENHSISSLELKERNIFNELKSVFNNKCFKIHAGMFLSGQAAVDFLTTLFIYYLTVCLNRANEFSMVLGTLLIAQLISMPIHTKISQKNTKTSPLKFGFSVWILALIASLFLSPASPTFLIYAVSGICGLGTSAAVLVPWSILPEVADVDEMITSKRREGIYSGMATFLRKMANGLAIGLIGLLLQWIGYVKPQEVGGVATQSAFTTYGIKCLFGIVPILFILLAIHFAKKYCITEEKYAVLMKEIDRRKNYGEASRVDENTRKVCEELTGHSYEKLWNSVNSQSRINGVTLGG